MQTNPLKSFSPYKHVLLFFGVLGMILIGGKSMAFGKVNLSSQVNGVLFQNGEPVPNATVTRSINWEWGNEQFNEVTTTNDQGHFSFPAKTASSFTAKIFPHEPVIEQKIVFTIGDSEYEGWTYAKHNYDELGELQGKPLNFICEINNEPEYRKTYGLHGAYGICQF